LVRNVALAGWLLGAAACPSAAADVADQSLIPDLPPAAQLAPGNGSPLPPLAGSPPDSAVTPVLLARAGMDQNCCAHSRSSRRCGCCTGGRTMRRDSLYYGLAPSMVAAAVLIVLGTSDRHIEGFGPPIHLTCSIGVAASDTLNVWGQHLLAHADTAQYAAKRSGRNQVQLAATVLAA